jgi:hypothetical protein
VTRSNPNGWDVTIADEDHPIHPCEAFTRMVPVDPALLQVLPRPITTGTPA